MKSPSFHPTLNRVLAGRGFTPRHITAFDSSTVMQEALAAFLRGKDYAVGGQTRLMRSFGKAALCILPARSRSWAYRMGARVDSVPAGSLQDFRSDAVSRWIASRYPRRRYPVAFVGSSNGAAVQLAAALKAPWLPQNLLVLVRWPGLDPDEPAWSLAAGRKAAIPLLAAAPDLQLHQMQDPVQDRLMSREALYFRLKRLSLGATYEQFLLERLEPGGTIVIVDCDFSWPCVEVGERHYFQLGGLGALDPSDYYAGGQRARAFLKDHGAIAHHWLIPSPNAEQPESEWGYAPQLTTDVLRFADRHGYRVSRLRFHNPEHLSPWLADLYRERVVHDCGAPDRLVVESFFLMDPWCVRRTGSVPFWTAFNAVHSAVALENYLDSVEPFEEIRAVLFSNGVRAPTTASPERWRRILQRARRTHGFLGVRENDYPEDFSVYFRYHEALESLPDAPRPPATLRWSDVEEYAAARGSRHPVQLEYLDD